MEKQQKAMWFCVAFLALIIFVIWLNLFRQQIASKETVNNRGLTDILVDFKELVKGAKQPNN